MRDSARNYPSLHSSNLIHNPREILKFGTSRNYFPIHSSSNRIHCHEIRDTHCDYSSLHPSSNLFPDTREHMSDSLHNHSSLHSSHLLQDT